MGTCTKVSIPAAGHYDKLRLVTGEVPSPGAGEVLIEVAAAGVNYADCIVRMGLYSSAKELVGWPITPGFEVAGHVAAVGEGVAHVAVGDRVVGVTLFGGYASHVVIPGHQVFPLPEALGFDEAAAFPAVFLTAWYALFDLNHPRPGQVALVHSAAGGVGSSLAQMLKIIGCRVVGVVGGTHKVETARGMGCDWVIDKSRQDLWPEARMQAPRGYDHIFDANGVATLGESYRHLASPGKLCVYGFATMLPRGGRKVSWPKLAVSWLKTPRYNPLDLARENKSVLAFNLSYLFEQRMILEEGMRDIMGWLAEGKLVTPPVQTFPLASVADAHRTLESGKTVGKLVLVP